MLFDHHGGSHWFATGGSSAMLTPALLKCPEDNEALFSVSIGPHHTYRQDHVKNLFRRAKHGHVLYNPQSGTLISPDRIMTVPEPVTRPDLHAPFEREKVEHSSVQWRLKFVPAIRSAFRANREGAGLTLICLEGDRAPLEVAAP